MPHYVKCAYCQQQFDRDTKSYAKINSRRYAHAECFLREKLTNPALKNIQIIDPTENVKCIYCKKIFNRTKEPCVLISDNKYAHKDCYDKEQNRELTDEEKLDEYIKKMFNLEWIPPNIRKQKKTLIEQYNYTYSGMLKTLIYGLEIKKSIKIDYKYPTINIIPYLYQEAYNYYYSLWLAQQSNEGKNIQDYVPKEEQITIKSPRAKFTTHRNSFQFILEDDINGI